MKNKTIIFFLLFVAFHCFSEEYETIISTYLIKPSKIVAEIESDNFVFLFIANEEIEEPGFSFYGYELFIVIDKNDNVLYSELLYSNSSHQFYFQTNKYFAVIFRDQNTYKDLIVGYDFLSEEVFRYSTQYRFISSFYKKNDNIYYSAEKYEKCITLLNQKTGLIQEFGDEELIVADFVEKNDQVYIIASYINPVKKEYYIIQNNSLINVSNNLELEEPKSKFLRDHEYDERKYSYIIDKYSIPLDP